MSQVKPKVFLPGGLASLCTEYKKLRDIVNSQIEVVSDEDLVSNPGIGTEITAALFYVHDPLKLQVFNRKEEGLLPALHLVCNNGVGVDHMPFSRMKQLGLRLTNTPGVLSDATADMAMALMLASGRQLGTGLEWAMTKTLQEKNQLFISLHLGQEISFSTLGIVGMGSIGMKVAQRAKAFNMTILYHNRNQRADEAAVGAKYYSDLLEMLPLCDFVIISCPLTAETKSLFTSQHFDIMKPTSHLINVARGAVVHTESLVDALKSKKIAAAGLDVTDPEPLPHDHPLLQLENVLVTPHWATATVQTRGKMLQLSIDNIKAFVEGKPLLSEVHI